jgi:hypothetical protein
MSEDNSWLLQTIVAKSDQLNAVDLVGGSQTYKVAKVSKCEGEQPVAIDIGDPKRPFKPCKSMRRVLIACWGANPVLWVGRQMTLFCDENVKWAGESVGGIRISHLSNLDVPKRDVQLNESRHKKTTWTVFNIETKVETGRISKATKAIAACKTSEELAKVWKQCEPLYAACDDDQKNVLSSAKTEQEEAVKNA